LLVLAAAGLVLTLLVWCAYFFKMESLARQRLEQLQARVGELERVEAPIKVAEAEIAEAQSRADRLLTLGEQRTQWLRLVSEIQAALPPEIWISYLKPVRAPRDPNNPTAPAPDGSAPGVVSKIELSGFGYIDKVASGQPIINFRDQLRNSALFDNGAGTDITWSPSPAADDFVREFKLMVTLKQPITQ
jgi:Tfp pilus assembly protein PilN